MYVVNIYYTMIMAWTLYYLGHIFIAPLPWNTCNNEWNSPNCVADRGLFSSPQNSTEKFNISVINLNNTIQEISDRRLYDVPTNNSLHIGPNQTIITAQEDFWQ